jgi:hypothetical protein
MDNQKPSTILLSFAKASYHRSENPVKRASWRVLLKEKSTMNIKGAYRNRNTKAIQMAPTFFWKKGFITVQRPSFSKEEAAAAW